MADKIPGKTEVDQWIEDYFEKKKGTGVSFVYGGRAKMHFRDKGITKVDAAEEYVKKQMKEGTFLNPTIHNAFERHFGGEVKAQPKQTDVEKKQAQAKAQVGNEKIEVEKKADEKTGKEEVEAEEQQVGATNRLGKSLAEIAKGLKDKTRKNEGVDRGGTFRGRGRDRYGGFADFSGWGPRNWGRAERSDNTVAIFVFLLTLALAILDYSWLHFAGFDYNKLIDILSEGGIKMILMSLIPIYTIAILAIKMLLYVSEEHNTIKWLIVVIPLLVLSNTLTNIYGSLTLIYYFSIFTSIAIGISIVWGYMLLEPERQELFRSWIFILIVLSFIFSYAALTDPRTILHLGVAAFVWLYFHSETGETSKANNWIAGLLLFDWVGWGALKILIPDTVQPYVLFNRYIFPVWFLTVALYSFDRKNSKFIKIVTTAVLLIYVFTLVDVTYGWVNMPAQAGISTQELEQTKSFGQKFLDKLKALPKKVEVEIDRGMVEATGGYYKGKVEKNEEEKLGVYLEGIEAADTKFFENEKVVIWGDLKARTLDEPIKVTMSCESGDVPGTIIPPLLADKEGYEIQTLEEIGFECSFGKEQLKVGTNSVDIKAEFNFKTLAFLKTYFMDIERIRALRRENIDPLKEYGITDSIPTAVYTNGPVKLGMGTIDPPLGVRDNEAVPSFVGVTVDPQWTGEIKKITNVEIDVPSVLEFTDLCRGGFEKVGEEEGYTKYRMKGDVIDLIKTPVTKWWSRRCSLTVPTANEVLGNTPVTTYYYRAKVEYIFEVEKSISVYIQTELVVEKKKLADNDCSSSCTSQVGCICGKGCKLAEGTEIGLNGECGGPVESE